MKRSTFALALILAVFLLSGPAAAQVNGVAVDSSKGVLLLGSPAGASNCKAFTTGAIRYNSTNPGIQYCDGTNWLSVGGMTLISTKTASASASLQFTSLPTTYNTLFLNCVGLVASGATFLRIIVGEGATPTWETGSHYTNMVLWTGTGAASPQQNLTTTAPYLVNMGSSTSTATPAQFKGYIDNVNSSTLHKIASFETGNGDNTSNNNYYVQSAWGFWNNDVNAVTGLEIIPDAGTITSGTCSLYGMN